MRILLVDDEVVALKALERRVDWLKYGFSEVKTAMDAEGARKILKESRIDLMLCDIEMPGDSGITLAGEVREEYPDTGVIMVTCHADFDYLKKSMKNRVVDYIVKPIDYEELDTILEKFIADRQESRAKEKREAFIKKAEEVQGIEEDKTEAALDLCKQYIEDHLAEKIYVEELAKLSYMNEQYFMRVFKKATGKSVTDYINSRRMQIAADLLRNTEKSISFIASATGSGDDSYFTKVFKKYSGYTPKEYRKQFGKS